MVSGYRRFPKLPDSPQFTSGEELTSNVISSCPRTHSSNQEKEGQLLSSASGRPTDTHCSLLSPKTSGLTNSTFYRAPQKDGVPFVASQLSDSVVQSTKLDGCAMENNVFSWDAIENLLDTPLNITGQNSQLENCTGVMIAEDHAKRTDWQNCADQLISVDDTLNPNWSDLLDDVNLPDPVPEDHGHN